jgi:hypothetical protein
MSSPPSTRNAGPGSRGAQSLMTTRHATDRRCYHSFPNVDADRSGQAAIELIVGLVAMLVLFAGLLQVSSLIKTHTDTMVQARTQAGEQAMLESPLLPVPRYIRDWVPGQDGQRHTPDDRWTPANADAFADTLVEQAVAEDMDWGLWQERDAKPNPVADMRSTVNQSAHFGLLRGHASSVTNLLPAIRHLVYNADTVEVSTEVWMTWTSGIY